MSSGLQATRGDAQRINHVDRRVSPRHIRAHGTGRSNTHSQLSTGGERNTYDRFTLIHALRCVRRHEGEIIYARRGYIERSLLAAHGAVSRLDVPIMTPHAPHVAETATQYETSIPVPSGMGAWNAPMPMRLE